jgi:hypothetical protein
MTISKKEITPGAKAKELVDKNGVEVADKIVDGLLTEIQESGWDQKRIDYYLDVKSGIRIIAEFKAKK